jgi:hypothetical protein
LPESARARWRDGIARRLAFVRASVGADGAIGYADPWWTATPPTSISHAMRLDTAQPGAPALTALGARRRVRLGPRSGRSVWRDGLRVLDPAGGHVGMGWHRLDGANDTGSPSRVCRARSRFRCAAFAGHPAGRQHRPVFGILRDVGMGRFHLEPADRSAPCSAVGSGTRVRSGPRSSRPLRWGFLGGVVDLVRRYLGMGWIPMDAA